MRMGMGMRTRMGMGMEANSSGRERERKEKRRIKLAAFNIKNNFDEGIVCDSRKQKRIFLHLQVGKKKKKEKYKSAVV